MLHLVLSALMVACCLGCESGWHSFGGNCYKFVSTQSYRINAENDCASMGAHIASILSSAENDYVLSFADQQWIGLTCPGPWYDKVPSWDDGSPVDYLNWAPGEPHGPSDEYCVWVGWENYPDKWDDVVCTKTLPYTCKKPDDASGDAGGDADCDSGWSESGDSCYKYVGTKRNRHDAADDCASMGGHIASILTYAENTLINSFAAQQWIGLRAIGSWDNKVPSWDDGSPVGYLNWAPGEPHGPSDESCVWIGWENYPDQWDDVVCTKNLPYTCKKPKGGSAEPVGSCESGWSAFGGSCYIIGGHGNYAAAESTCESLGATVASVHSHDENEFIIHLPGVVNHVTIGLRDAASEGNWGWADGSPVDYTRWAPGEPNNSGNEDCTMIYGGTHEWNDFKCGNSYHYVCKKSQGGSSSSCTSGYTEFQGRCYKYYSQHLNFNAAQSLCEGEGANLVSIHSQAEQDFIMDNNSVQWIGIASAATNPHWTDGTATDFSKWAPGQPSGGTQNCGWIGWDAYPDQWDDIHCTDELAFTCKK